MTVLAIMNIVLERNFIMNTIIFDERSINLGESLRALREKHQLSQCELAKILHVNNGTISKYEHDVRIPDIYMLMKFAELYQVSLDQLIGQAWGSFSVRMA